MARLPESLGSGEARQLQRKKVGAGADEEALSERVPGCVALASRRAGILLSILTVVLVLLAAVSLAVNWPILVEEDFAAYLRSDGQFHSYYEAYTAARTLAREKASSPRRLEDDSIRLMQEEGLDTEWRRLQRAPQLRIYEIKLIYATRDGSNIFSEKHLPVVRDFEQKLRTLPEYGSFCVPLDTDDECELPSSVINFFYASVDSRGGYVLDGQGDQLLPVQQMLLTMSSHDAFFIDRDFGISKDNLQAALQGNITRSVFRFCITGYAEDRGRQEQAFRSFVSEQLFPFLSKPDACGPDLRVYYFGDILQAYEVSVTVWQDARLAYGSLAFIFLYLLGHLKSLVLTVAALVCISLSFPISYGVYCLFVGHESMLALNFLSLFVVLGVGADDVFVLHDVWRHSSKLSGGAATAHDTYGRRMWYMYRKAGMAIFATSATTAASFFANLVSAIGPLRQFGFFMGVCITTNWLAVASLFPLVLLLHDWAFSRSRKVGTEMEECFVKTEDVSDCEAAVDTPTAAAQNVDLSADAKAGCVRIMGLPFLAAAGVVLPLWALYGAVMALKPASGLPRFFPPDSNLGALQDLQQRFGNETPTDHVASRARYCDGVLQLSGDCGPASHTAIRIPMTTPAPEPLITHQSTASSAWSDFDVTVQVPSELASQQSILILTIQNQLGLQPGSIEIDVGTQVTARRLSDSVEATLHFHHLTASQRAKVQRYLQEHPDLGGVIWSSSEPAQTSTPRSIAHTTRARWGQPEPSTRDPAPATSSSAPFSKWLRSSEPAQTSQPRHSVPATSAGPRTGVPTSQPHATVPATSAAAPVPPSTHQATRLTEATPPPTQRPAPTAAPAPATTPRGRDSTRHVQTAPPTRATDGNIQATTLMSTLPPHAIDKVKKPKGLPKDRAASVNVVWGLVAGSEGKSDPRFNWRNPHVQQALVDFCSHAVAKSELKVALADCWPQDFEATVRASRMPFPMSPYNSRQVYDEIMQGYFSKHQRLINTHTARRLPSWELEWVSMNFRVDVDTHSSSSDIRGYMQLWEDFVSEETKRFRHGDAGAAIGRGMVVCDLFVRAEAEDKVLGSALSSWLMSVACALFAVIAFTRSALLSGIATFAIFGTAACSLFTITSIFKWDFGLMEAVALIVFCGFSVDYPLHVVQAYVQERKNGAAVSAALGEVGCAITSGCLTTVGAAVFLLFCQVQLFTRFGQMLVVNMLYSLVFAVVWLPSVLEALNLCGPDQGSASSNSTHVAASTVDGEEMDQSDMFAPLADSSPRRRT